MSDDVDDDLEVPPVVLLHPADRGRCELVPLTEALEQCLERERAGDARAYYWPTVLDDRTTPAHAAGAMIAGAFGRIGREKSRNLAGFGDLGIDDLEQVPAELEAEAAELFAAEPITPFMQCDRCGRFTKQKLPPTGVRALVLCSSCAPNRPR